jgi:hypothetical protein
MIINVQEDAIQVDEPDDLMRLMVLSRLEPSSTIDRLRERGLATNDFDEERSQPASVWLDISRLHALATNAEGERGEGWAGGWAAMIEFADRNGWVREGAYVRAHIELEG